MNSDPEKKHISDEAASDPFLAQDRSGSLLSDDKKAPTREGGISVIVPVFNTRKWLPDSMESVLHQSFADFELICVDDGSEDDSFSYLQELARQDPRLKVYRIPHNGQGAARQEGMRHALKKYIYFFDSDDLLEKNALEKMYALAEKRQTDVLLFDGSIFYDDDISDRQKLQYGKSAYIRSRAYADVTDGEALFVRMSRDGVFSVSPCLMLIRRDYLTDAGIEFAGGCIYEDNLFAVQVLTQTKRASHENIPLFKRRLRAGSTVTHRKNEYDLVSYHYILTRLLAYTVEQDLNEETVNEILKLAETLQRQAASLGSELKDSEKIDAMMREKGPQYAFLYRSFFRPLLTGEPVSFEPDENLRRQLLAVQSSRAFRIGKAITYLPHQIKKLITGHD